MASTARTVPAATAAGEPPRPEHAVGDGEEGGEPGLVLEEDPSVALARQPRAERLAVLRGVERGGSLLEHPGLEQVDALVLVVGVERDHLALDDEAQPEGQRGQHAEQEPPLGGAHRSKVTTTDPTWSRRWRSSVWMSTEMPMSSSTSSMPTAAR